MRRKDFAQKAGLRLIEVLRYFWLKYVECSLRVSFYIAVFSILFRKQLYVIKMNNEFDVCSVFLRPLD